MNDQAFQRGKHLLAGGARFSRAPGLLARLIAPGFNRLLDRIDAGLEKGTMTLHLPGGATRRLGGRAPGFDTELSIHDWRALIRLATSGSIGWYQAWEAGEGECTDLTSLFAIFGDNAVSLGSVGRAKGPFRWAVRLAHRFNRNNRAGAQRNIQAHYDLGNDFYAQWLDPSMTYSSARFDHSDTLEEAQRAKWQALQARIGQAQSVLEIGCGWGSLANHLQLSGMQVTAISLSDEQLAWAREHHHPGIDFLKQDYRDVRGQYDAIVSVEMVEALGREYWPTFMDAIARNLKPGGRAAIQFIAMRDELFEAYAASADFIQAYVFPGGILIRSSEFRELAEARGLRWRDDVAFGQDYAHTLKCWRENFDLAVAEGRLPPGFDERFIGLWRFYLSYCEGGFLAGSINVHQVTLVREK